MVDSAEDSLSSSSKVSASRSELTDWLPLLHRLDQKVERAVVAAQSRFGREAATDPYRGMHIDAADVERLLAREPGAPSFQGYEESEEAVLPAQIPPNSRLEGLQKTFELSEFDLDVVAIALAPELDRRYESIYAYLQDDVRCKRPSVDLALNLLCENAIARLENRDCFASTAPLIRNGLLTLESEQAKPTLLTQELHLSPQVIRFLLHQPGVDAGCELIQPTVRLEDLPEGISEQIKALLAQNWQTPLYFQGRDHTLKQQAANAIAHALNQPLLVATEVSEFEPLFREVWFQNALLYLEIDELDERAITALCNSLYSAQENRLVILSGNKPFRATKPLGIVTLAFSMPDFIQRQSAWRQHLEAANLTIDESVLEALADRFRLSATQIVGAIATARHTAQWKSEPIDLFAAARAQSGQDVVGLARKIEPVYSWDDIVLPADQVAQLQELCNQAKYRPKVYQDWGFGARLSRGKGLNVLFSGLPGTGKTMAAEVIAQELQLDLYQIDLSQIVSKYIGETEKNLDRIFTAAASANAILLFDEADALFGKRSDVQDAHDRYANIEVGYLLQKMEEYEGIAILTTNLRSSIDDAFVRRLRFIIDFPLPNERDRKIIWERILPDAIPRHADIDLNLLARQHKISGANIRNIVLAAAFLAASDGNVVTMEHFSWATKREYQKMGKLFMDEN
jgi:DNA polymerase III delta prime subunit